MIYFKKDLERARKEGEDRINKRDNLQINLLKDQIRDLDAKNAKTEADNDKLARAAKGLGEVADGLRVKLSCKIKDAEMWRTFFYVSICFNVIFVSFLIKFTAQ